MEGKSPASEARSELVRLTARLVIEEALEGEAADALLRRWPKGSRRIVFARDFLPAIVRRRSGPERTVTVVITFAH